MIRVSVVIGLFALAYAVITLAIGFFPINHLLRKVMGSGIMPGIWRNSMVQLTERTAVATLACWIGLAISGRVRGRLTGSGMLALGAAMSGALAAAVDVGVHKFWVRHLIRAAQSGPWLAFAVSAAMTLVISVLVTLLLITRSTKIVTANG